MSWGISLEGIRNKKKGKKEIKERKERGGGKGSSTDAKVFQFSALKHEPTPQLGCPGRLLNKTFIRENGIVYVLSGTCKLYLHLLHTLVPWCVDRRLSKNKSSGLVFADASVCI